MGRPAIDLTGQVFGRLTVFCRVATSMGAGKHAKWLCLCSCGVERVVSSSALRGGQVSCGCYGRERAGEAARTHGMSGTPTMSSWRGMIDRCFNIQSKDWPRYGARGITVCDRWMTFENFLADMGERPEGKTIDRLDNDAGYMPGNCVWAAPKAQSGNRSNTVKMTHSGETRTLVEWAEVLGISAKTIHTRLMRGESVERALTVGRLAR